MISEAARPMGEEEEEDEDENLCGDLDLDLAAERREDCQVGEVKESMAGDV